MRTWNRWARIAGFVAALMLAGSGNATLPYGHTPVADVYDYANYLYIASGDCSQGAQSINDLPPDFDCVDSWKFTDYRDTGHPGLANSAQELYGVEGAATNRAWEVSTGRPDVLIAVLDSGAKWDESLPSLANKIYLNRGELPKPICANGKTGNPNDSAYDGYDCDGNGVFNAADYSHDPRVKDLNANGYVDPEDLIRTFSDGVDDDHNGYVDDISGWDFYENDNDPQDDVKYGHGTGEMEDSSSEAGLGENGQCPNCMVMMLRVGDSFIADINRYAQAVIYAVDNRARVVQEALGTINHTSFAQVANDYAYTHGVIINASEADEAAGHHNWPAALDHRMVVNSIRNSEATLPYSYLQLNGCTNFGGYTYVSIPSAACSSEATGRSSGISGLLMSAALNAIDRGDMTPYVNDDGSLASYPLSAEEAMQLWRLAADDVDFSTPCPEHANCDHSPDGGSGSGRANNYSMIGPVATRRYPTVKGWDLFTGYGRANNGRLLRMIGRDGDPGRIVGNIQLKAQDRIPPEADISSPLWWAQYPYGTDNQLIGTAARDAADSVVVRGRVAANRVTRSGGSFDWVLEWAPGAQGEPWPDGRSPAGGSAESSSGPWFAVASGSGLTHAYVGELGRISIASIVAGQAGAQDPFAIDPTSPYQPERYAIRLRVRVLAHPANAQDNINNEAVFQKQVDVYPAAESAIRDDLGRGGARGGATASPSFEDIDGDGRDELIVASDDGLVHAYTDVAAGTELLGWPVHTLTIDSIPRSGNNAFSKAAVPSDFYTGILGGAVVVADLDDDGRNEVVAADLDGRVYAWEPDGSLRRGFPVTVDYSISKETPCGPSTIPNCDDYESTGKKKDRFNRRNAFISFSPSVGDLDQAYPGLEIVASAGDGHVYAWHADGTPVPGWPVVLRDPDTVATMSAGTQYYTFKNGVQAEDGGMLITTPSLGDIDGDGQLEVVAGANEEYIEKPAAPPSLDILLNLLKASGQVSPGNTRLYALHHDGTLHPSDAGDVNPDVGSTPHTEDQAYLKGWPVKMAMVTTDQLPTVGEGTDAPALLADLDGDGKPEVLGVSSSGPGYIFEGDGSSWLGSKAGEPEILAVNAPAHDAPAFAALGAISIGSLDGGGHMTVAGSNAGVQRILDIAIEGDQYKAQDLLGLWDVRSGQYEPGGAVEINDLQFFAQPTIADVTGDGRAEVIQGSAVNDLIEVSLGGDAPEVVRLHTGGWTDSSPAVGAAPIGADPASVLSIATTTREGYLRVIPTRTPIDNRADCVALSQWPRYQHDARNSGNYGTDGERPAPAQQLKAVLQSDGSARVSLIASGDSRHCGQADHYEIRRAASADDTRWAEADPVATYPVGAAAGQSDVFSIAAADLSGGPNLLLRIYDRAGNGSAVAAFSPQAAGVGSPTSSGAFDPIALLLLGITAIWRRRRRL